MKKSIVFFKYGLKTVLGKGGGFDVYHHHARSLTFYATISDIQNNTFTVTGMEVNDINFRGNFRFSIAEGTKITWRYTDISADDLDVGDNIAITFTGEILETDPGQIQQIEVIQLLGDEK